MQPDPVVTSPRFGPSATKRARDGPLASDTYTSSHRPSLGRRRDADHRVASRPSPRGCVEEEFITADCGGHGGTCSARTIICPRLTSIVVSWRAGEVRPAVDGHRHYARARLVTLGLEQKQGGTSLQEPRRFAVEYVATEPGASAICGLNKRSSLHRDDCILVEGNNVGWRNVDVVHLPTNDGFHVSTGRKRRCLALLSRCSGGCKGPGCCGNEEWSHQILPVDSMTSLRTLNPHIRSGQARQLGLAP